MPTFVLSGGIIAFQAYAGPLGIKLSGRPLQTQDADFAQFRGISENIGGSTPPILEVLRGVDPTFKSVPNITDPFVTTAYRNKTFYRVDFLTPNRGSDDHQGKPARMKALGGVSAQPPRSSLLHHSHMQSCQLAQSIQAGHCSPPMLSTV